MYCQIALPIPTYQLYTYKIPDKFKELVFVGSRVYVQIKNQEEPIIGFVVDILNDYNDFEQIKPIYDVVDSLPLPNDLMKLATLMSEKYFCPLGLVFDTIFPSYLSFKPFENVEPYYEFNNQLNIFEEIKNDKLNATDKLIIQFLYNNGKATIKDIEVNLSLSTTKIKNSISKLNDLNIIKKTFQSKNEIDKYSNYEINESKKNIIFTNEQLQAIDTINIQINQNQYFENLLFGVTGSGKTEVYIEITKKIISLGKSVIILVPEIALTEHLKHRYLDIFGDKLAIWHSLINKSEKNAIYSKIANKKISVILGARSAVFAPFDNLGCIIIDEEHDSSYKQQTGIKYDTREVAKMRLKINNGILILGSATPELRSYYNISNNQTNAKLILMTKRVENRPMPTCHIVDMSYEFAHNKNKSIFSNLLLEKINECLSKNQQCLLFLNRRGHSTFVLCRNCGHVIKCLNCDVSMTYHLNFKKLLCHYCSYNQVIPNKCPKCSSQYIRFFGIGTEKVEEEFKLRFPNITVARLDSDVITSKKISNKILEDFANKKIKVLIGTQMLSKGFDFHNITLVGIISADTMLNMPDMFSAEKTFQLLSQVIGRTGRGEFEGECVIQTYNPNNYAIKFAAINDYLGFYNEELKIRQALFYPPFSHMVKISFYHKEETKVIETAKEVANEILIRLNALNIDKKIKVNPPVPALIPKMQNIYKYNLYIFSETEDLVYEALFDIFKKYNFTNKKQCVKITIDILPDNTY